MARRENELFIGREYLNIEGRQIKHPSLIKYYATPNIKKINEQRLDMIGLDLETDSVTAELKLLGFWNGTRYHFTTHDFLDTLFAYIRHCKHHKKVLAWWNRLDPSILFKQFLYLLDNDDQRFEAIERYGKISGEWDNKENKWKVRPVVQIELGGFIFGIKQAIRSSIQFFYHSQEDKKPFEVWAFDIAQLYESGLEKEASIRLPYYTKVDESAHLVDWKRFETDNNYKWNVVLASNKLDARAVYDLGNSIQEDFKNAFGAYPKMLISQGSLARSAIIAVLTKLFSSLGDEKLIRTRVTEEFQSMGFINYWDSWVNTYGDYAMKDFYSLCTESYSGGYIEAIAYGYSKEGWYADIASAYPGVIQNLYDLRGAIIQNGTGEPPHTPNSYCVIRGIVNIPSNVQYHSITVKHPINTSTNIRPVGKYRASYLIEERDYLLSLGATFEDETWYNVVTMGVKSPLASVCIEFVNLRNYFKSIGSTSQYMAKIASNSLYGITFEAVDMYEEDEQGNVQSVGYRGGEMWNPLFASYITGLTRLKLAKASNEISKRGGQPIILMTDSILWQGNFEDMPSDMWREKKTLGYFEKPTKVYDIVSLGSGRYNFRDDKDEWTVKRRGLNAIDMQTPDGVELDDFNWMDALKIMQGTGNDTLKIKSRTLVTPGVILSDHSYSWQQMGLVTEVDKEVTAVVGLSKRMLNDDDIDPYKLATGLMLTHSIYLQPNMFAHKGVIDQTLPQLRSLMMNKTATTKQGRRATKSLKYSEGYRNTHKDEIALKSKEKYQRLRMLGYSCYESSKMCKWSDDRLKEVGVVC